MDNSSVGYIKNMTIQMALGVVLTVMGTAALQAAELHADTVAAWSLYVQATEQRIAGEIGTDGPFLVQDFHPDSTDARRAVLKGGIVVDKMQTRHDGGDTINVPDGAIHHWRGSIFIPEVTLDDVLYGVKSPLRQEDLQEDVIESRVLERDGDRMRVFLKLRRKKFVTVHYNTEHVMEYARHSTERADRGARRGWHPCGT